MLNTQQFGTKLKELGFTLASGVPCSLLKSFINFAINDCTYFAAANEGDAVAIAAGAYLGGQKSMVLMQNSGLTNAISPLTSLIHPFQLPLLGFVSLRGEPGVADEPQHELTGQITTQLFDLMQIEWQYLAHQPELAYQQLVYANQCIEKNQAFFFVVTANTFDEEALLAKQSSPNKTRLLKTKQSADQLPPRYDVLTRINSCKDSQTIHIATTGKTGRELYEVEDACNNFYMVGSMGCASSLGLGLALSSSAKDIVVIDGDGSMLMRMGSLATNGYYQPGNLLHILLDNEAYDSTGGQQTVSPNLDFVQIASACGYLNAIYLHNLAELESAIMAWKKAKGLTFLYLKIAQGSQKQLSRPGLLPYQVKARIQAFLAQK